MTSTPGLTLRREPVPVVEALPTAAGPEPLLDTGLRRRHLRLPAAPLQLVAGLATRSSWWLDLADQRDRRWWPQGVAVVPGRLDLVASTAYARRVGEERRPQGARLTLHDVRRGRYAHVRLVEPDLTGDGWRPWVGHAGGLVWLDDDRALVAATARGLVEVSLRDLRPEPSVPEGWVLPVSARWVAGTDDGRTGPTEPLRYSFCSLTPAGDLLVGEYGRGAHSRRLVRWTLAGAPVPTSLPDGPRGMQGAVLGADGRLLVSTSRGPTSRGSLWTGRPGALVEHPHALPVGCEDLDLAGSDLWTVSEHPWRRGLHRIDTTGS
ncbi:MAG: hypothetical protein CMH83_13030 [Nocardioides sp.]|nr:hypothetical protein [Nocardioides sp.]